MWKKFTNLPEMNAVLGPCCVSVAEVLKSLVQGKYIAKIPRQLSFFPRNGAKWFYAVEDFFSVWIVSSKREGIWRLGEKSPKSPSVKIRLPKNGKVLYCPYNIFSLYPWVLCLHILVYTPIDHDSACTVLNILYYWILNCVNCTKSP